MSYDTALVMASHNAGKLTELRRILAPAAPKVQVLGLDDVGVSEEPAETEWTFEGNALLKARAAVAATGRPSLADDSGLCVDVLNDMPGVLSARWAGPAKDPAANNELLLAQLAAVPDEERTAEFRCVLALCLPDGPGALGRPTVSTEVTEVGRVRGRILREPRGTGGFGYDPLFAPDGYDVSTAELDAGDKDAISHRGRALHAMVPHVAAALSARE